MNINENLDDDMALDNVIEKLKFYMEKNHQSLHGLSITLGIPYMPLYRLINKKFIPTIHSLQSITQFFDSTVSEFTNNNLFIDLNCYENIEAYVAAQQAQTIRLYLPYAMRSIAKSDLFVIKVTLSNLPEYSINNIKLVLNPHYFQLFQPTSKIDIGLYLIKHGAKILVVDVTMITADHILVKSDNESYSILNKDFKPLAKFICHFETNKQNEDQAVYGKLTPNLHKVTKK